jgi:hypothetical protein
LRIAAREEEIRGISTYVHLDSGANVGMMNLQTAKKAGLSLQIKNGKPSFSTRMGKWQPASVG